MEEGRLVVEEFAHSPVHYAVAMGDSVSLGRLLASLPSLAHPSEIRTEADSAREEHLAAEIAAVLDRRDVPRRDTALHLAVRLDRTSAVAALANAGADPSLQNAAGWTALQEALCLRRRRLALMLLRHHRRSAWAKFRRRLPPLLVALRRVSDFYLELEFHFESPLLPFLPRVAPSDTYRIWKRATDLRADTSLAGFDGLRIRRSDQSFLFLGTGTGSTVPPGSLLVLHRGRREVRDAFDGAEAAAPAADEADIVADASAYRPGLDITAAQLVSRTNWRRREKIEMVGEWKARVYEIHNVVFSFKTMKACAEEGENDGDDGQNLVVPLDLHEDDDEGFLVAEIPEMPPRHSCYEPRVREREELGQTARRRSVDVRLREEVKEWARPARRSVDVRLREEDKEWARPARAKAGRKKEKEMVKSLLPVVWLTEDFPLKLEELMPLLDILANKVKAVRRLRELLTTKFPPGTFPVKVAIPILPTVRVVVTFTKFAYLTQSEQFFTPLSSPRLLPVPEDEENHKIDTHKSSWLRWNSSSTKTSVNRSKSVNTSQVIDHIDPFDIPTNYKWVSIHTKSQNSRTMKPKKGKQMA
ncbi:ankyrin repeat domain-containing protein 13C-like [Zingiber officinale]|uniref:Ankyrin repeat domain-containing protein n=1 Tax=Zingiber officinale TaxID=94328 RepID=A0A8J5HYG1_ZINOF|nr:ankyrin repeat domain-containing protein 13C-like [Zingiber officinale]KAG6532235.1 hypothetical protein ZIOFF_006074 [Zingiber officinale]